MHSVIRLKNFIFYQLISLTFLSLLVGCGAAEESDRVPARPQSLITDPNPSLQNVGQWRNLWDGKSWIVAWKKGESPFEKSFLLSRLLDNLLHGVAPTNLREARLALSQNISLELVHLPPQGVSEGLAGFAFVQFTENSPWWSNILNGFSIKVPSGLSGLEALRWQALTTLPEVSWAEPNLESTLFEDTTSSYSPPPELGSSSFAPVIKRIRADIAWQKAVDTDGLPKYEYKKRGNLNWTNVAVIDTGTDWKHSDLWDDDYEQSHIYRSPKEAINCNDDDGNGYVDDLYGVDATIEMEEWNKQARAACKQTPPTLPNPGSAEVGGPGQPCPTIPSTVKVKKESCGHGTHVSGIIAAKHGSDASTFGVCPSCRIIPIRVAEKQVIEGVTLAGRIDDSSQIRALSYIMGLTKDGVPVTHIVNMSLGKYFVSRSLAFWFRRLLDAGILVVAAAGNDDTDTPNYPAAYAPVLAVCATSEKEAEGPFSQGAGRGIYSKTGFSNFGSWVDICAPGLDIVSTLTGGGPTSKSGTSQASPVVAGAAGFLKSIFPDKSGAQIAALLQKYANAPVLYHFGSGATNIPEGATKTNTRNRLYEGWLEDGIQIYQLGTGFLDLAAAATEGKECWDTANPATCVSYVFQNGERNLQSQLDGGCVMSVVGAGRPSGGNPLASMPFVMLQVYLVHRLVRRLRHGRSPHDPI